MLERWGGLVARRPVPVLVTGLLVALAAAAYGLGVFGSLSQGGFEDPGSDTVRELHAEQRAFGNRSPDVVAIYSDPRLRADDPRFRSAVADVVAEVPRGTAVSVTPYYAAQTPGADGMVSHDGHHAQLVISLAGSNQDEFLDSYDRLAPHLRAEGLRTELAGPYPVFADVNEQTSADLRRAETVSMPVVVLLALLIFGSLTAALMPAAVGVLASVGAMAVVRLLTTATDVSVFAVNVITLLGLGLAIDYALFMVSRFREELAAQPVEDPRIALVRTMRTAGRTVLVSGLTVAASLSSLLVFPQTFLRSMGYGGVAAVLVAVLASLTVLPAILVLLGRRIDAGRLPWRRGRQVTVDAHGRWARLAHLVMRRPVVVIVASVVVLVGVASPFLGASWGSVDYRVLPPSASAHAATETLNREFGPEQSTANLLLRGTDQQAVAMYSRAVEDVRGVVAVQPVASKGDTTLLRAVWDGNGQTPEAQQLLRDIRDVEPTSGTVLAGGPTADTVDLVDSVGQRLPWMALIVVVVMFVLLFAAFGSLVLPVKAIVMNALSITASFGVVTWIFGDGHLSGLLGFTPQGFLDVTNPILMLAVLFGLSMDYEVFLLSRVREQWDLTGDNTAAVASGVQRTGQIITSAALLLGVVIGAFSLSGLVLMKMIGIGMLVALLVDATVVRALLVPATMRLLGRWNWWAPGPLRRWWERHGLHESEAAPAREHQPA